MTESDAVTLVLGLCPILFLLVLFIVIWSKIRRARRAKESAWKQQQLVDAQIRYYSRSQSQPTSFYREKEIIREIVRVPCRYCGTLIENTATFCPSCGART